MTAFDVGLRFDAVRVEYQALLGVESRKGLPPSQHPRFSQPAKSRCMYGEIPSLSQGGRANQPGMALHNAGRWKAVLPPSEEDCRISPTRAVPGLDLFGIVHLGLGLRACWVYQGYAGCCLLALKLRGVWKYGPQVPDIPALRGAGVLVQLMGHVLYVGYPTWGSPSSPAIQEGYM